MRSDSGRWIVVVALLSNPAFAEQVRRPRAEMPRYPANIVSDQELADIHAFLAAQKAGPRAKDIPLLRD